MIRYLINDLRLVLSSMPFRSGWIWYLVFAVAFASAVLSPAAIGTAVAQVIQPPASPAEWTLNLPAAPAGSPASPGSGFTAVINVPSSINPQYVDATVQLQSMTGPLTAQRNLVIRFSPIDVHFPANKAVVAEFPFVFQQGQSQLLHHCPLPKWTHGYSYQVEILEDGTVLPDYVAEMRMSAGPVSTRSNLSMFGGTGANYFAFVSELPSGMPGIAAAKNVSNRSVYGIAAPDGSTPMFKLSPNLMATPWESGVWVRTPWKDLPSDWRFMRHINFVVATAEDLRQPEFAEKRETLRHWMMMGGTLVVQFAPDRPHLESALDVTLGATDETQAVIPVLIGTLTRAAYDVRLRYEAVYEEAKSSSVPTRVAAEKRILDRMDRQSEEFGSRWTDASLFRVGAGSVIALAEDLQSDLDFGLLSRISDYKQSPMLQRGVDPLFGDSRYARWLIPGVSQPPVYTFIGALTLFVLLVGPLAYRWTSRSGRSHLMFLIAPLLAILTTVLMFTYSVLSDGFGTQIRIRQITWVDSRTGLASERTRATLFAGLSPREGLQFPAKAEVFPYPSIQLSPWRDLPTRVRDLRTKVSIDQDHQAFNQAVLPARTQTQFVTHQVRENLGSLELKNVPPAMSPKVSASDDLSSPKKNAVRLVAELTSSFTFDLRNVVVRSEDGRYWKTEALPAGGSAEAVWLSEEKDVSKELGTLYILNRPLGEVAVNRSGGKRKEIPDLITLENRQIDRNTPPTTDGIFESMLERMLFVQGDLASGMFVGLSEPSKDAAPIDDSEVVQSVRYVMGTIR